ncbi:porin [Vreelandella utahensis]|uniref:porin n=1 Tax=Vreelandella halophila TaxID=86177 RepID=UPI0015C3F87A|nr:porin [Halomonas utahensis]
MKKKILALAVSGGLAAAPMGAMAAPEVYGLIDIGLESYSDSDGVGSEIFAGLNSVGSNSDDRDFALSNGLQSRIGVRGSEELDVADLTASYNMEFSVDVLDEDGGTASGDLGTRLGWVALGSDWGKVKVGSQWQALYEFGGWNTHRTDVHGYGSYYYTTGNLSNSQAFGFRQDSAISYEYGSAWGHSDPFAAQVTLGIGEGTADGNNGTVQNEEGITSLQAAFQYSIDQRISVNAVYATEFNSYDTTVGYANTTAGALNQEPSLYNVGGRWSVTDALELGVNYTNVDLDDAGDNNVDSIALASFMDFGNGLSGHLGVAQASDDRADERDMDLNVYGYIKQKLSDRTDIRLELETADYDDSEDGSLQGGTATIALVALQHNF